MLETVGRALALRGTGRIDEAAQVAASLVGSLQSTASNAVYLPDIVEILLATGQRVLAAELPADAGFRIAGLVWPQHAQTRALLHVDAGEAAEAEAEFKRALSGLRPLGTPFALARCLHHYGALLLGLDRADEAVLLLEEARTLFRSLRATPWTERTDALLAPVAAAS